MAFGWPPQIKFVTHGAIDGYSRLYLKCAQNNRAATVLSAFLNAVYVHGLLSVFAQTLVGKMWRYGDSWWNNIVQQQLLLAAPRIMSVFSASGVMCICV